MKTFIAITVGGLVVAALALAAPINRTITISGSSATWSRICFENRTPIRAEITASALLSDGSPSPENGATQWDLSPSQATTVSAFATGQGLTRWRTDRGLEQ